MAPERRRWEEVGSTFCLREEIPAVRRRGSSVAHETALLRLFAYRGWHRWFGELRSINRGIRLNFGQLEGILAVQPREDELIGQLDSGHIAIIREVNLCGS